MYKIRRVYRTKPGEAANVAKLVYKQAKIYQDAGHSLILLFPTRVHSTGETNIVYGVVRRQIMSPSRPGNNIPQEVYEPAASTGLYLKVNISSSTK
ncbi:MAG: hypothetical protein Ct9H300mP11_32780 [Chloroflexota bacterium]|nr:MAG: hypothetical protein Ct9H300mP11_32780 [Chloroflexota bacterium]